MAYRLVCSRWVTIDGDLPIEVCCMNRVSVVAAVIENQGRILCVQRPEHKFDYISRKWEFPGGKIETGESPYAALVRELHEELNIKVTQAKQTLCCKTQLDAQSFHLHVWHIVRYAGKPIGQEQQTIAWVNVSELSNYNILPGNQPILAMLQAQHA